MPEVKKELPPAWLLVVNGVERKGLTSDAAAQCPGAYCGADGALSVT